MPTQPRCGRELYMNFFKPLPDKGYRGEHFQDKPEQDFVPESYSEIDVDPIKQFVKGIVREVVVHQTNINIPKKME